MLLLCAFFACDSERSPSFWRIWCFLWWIFPTMARMSWRSWLTNPIGNDRSSWESRIFSNRYHPSPVHRIITQSNMVVRPAMLFESVLIFRMVAVVTSFSPAYRSSSCYRLRSQTVEMDPCCGWRSWPTSAMPHSDTSAAFVTEFYATLSRTTAKIRYSLNSYWQ